MMRKPVIGLPTRSLEAPDRSHFLAHISKNSVPDYQAGPRGSGARTNPADSDLDLSLLVLRVDARRANLVADIVISVRNRHASGAYRPAVDAEKGFLQRCYPAHRRSIQL